MSQMVTPETVYPASSPRIRRPEFVLVFAVIALMLAAGVALVIWTSAKSTPATIVAPGPLTPAQVSQARAEAMVALGAARWLASPQNVASLRAAELAAHLEAGWLASPSNVASLRAAELAAYETERWLASPQNVASLRAAELAAHLEARWLASQQGGEPGAETAVPKRWAQVPI